MRTLTLADVASPRLSWNVRSDISQLLEYHFMVNALIAAGVVAVAAGLIGWMMVLRREAFAGHTLSMMAFPGASAAALAGVPAALGYACFCGAGALAIGSLAPAGQRSLRNESASIGSVQALALAAGFLFVSLYGGVLGDLETLLFGNPLAVSNDEVLALCGVLAATVIVMAVIARPLLFASVDPEVALARGVRVGALSRAFLLVLALAVAATSQVTGPLLVFSLLVVPAASAQAITARPLHSLLLTVAFGLAVAWLGLGLAYFSPYPASCFIAALAFALYAVVRLAQGAGARLRRAPHEHDAEPPPRGVIA